MTEQQYRSIADRDKGDAIDWDAKPDLRTRVADLVPLSLLDGRDPRQDVFEVADQILAVVQPSLPTREQIATVYASAVSSQLSPGEFVDALDLLGVATRD